MIILFVISTTGNRNNSECKSAAVFLQYFLLSVFSWSAIEGFTSFRGLVQPMATKIENFMWKAVAIGWGKFVTCRSIVPLLQSAENRRKSVIDSGYAYVTQ